MDINNMPVSIKINDDFVDGLTLGLNIAQQLISGKEFDNTAIDELTNIVIEHTKVTME